MATQAKNANPYNANKEWHNQKEKTFVSADEGSNDLPPAHKPLVEDPDAAPPFLATV